MAVIPTFEITENRVTRELVSELNQLQDMQEEGTLDVTSEMRTVGSRLSELRDTLSNNVPIMAREMSKTLGMQEGVSRSVNSALHSIIRSNKDIRVVLESGGRQVEEMQQVLLSKMVDQMRQQSQFAEMEREHLELIVKESVDWKSAVETATSILYPIIQTVKGIGEDFRSMAVKVPLLGRFATREMVEHYKTAFSAATNEIKKHTDQILAPVGILVDPLVGITKGFGKMLGVFSKPIEYEKETAMWQQDTYKAIKGLPEVFAKEIGLLTGAVNEQTELQRELELERDREVDVEETSFWKKFGLLLVGVAGLIMGTITKYIIIPFEIIGKSLFAIAKIFPKIGNIFSRAFDFFKGLPIFAKISDKVADTIKAVSMFFSRVAGHLGFMKRWFDKTLGVFKSIGGFFSGITGHLGFMKKWFDKTLGVFKSIGGFFSRVAGHLGFMKRWFDNTVNAFKSIGGFFSGITGHLGFMKRWFDKTLGVFKSIGGFFSGMAKQSKIFANIASMFGPFMKTFVDAFKFGFRILGWPLTIIMGFIDFVKGFVGKQGNLMEKYYSGLKSVFMGLFELPIKFFGWIVDKILGLFGVEIEGGSGKKILDIIGGFFDFLGSVFGWLQDKMTGMLSKIPFIGKMFKKEEIQDGQDEIEITKSTINASSDLSGLASDAESSKTGFMAYAADTMRAAGDTIVQSVNTLRETNVTNNDAVKTMVRETVASTVTDVKRPPRDKIPENAENLGVLLLNSSWGLN